MNEKWILIVDDESIAVFASRSASASSGRSSAIPWNELL
jgi:hypothetical protein